MPPSPEYQHSASENLPEQTPEVIISSVRIPCIMVDDNHWDAKDRLRSSPYYLMQKRQFWKRIENLSLAPGEKRESTFKYGMTETDQYSMEKTVGISIGMDAGFSFEGLTLGIKESVTSELKVSISQTTVKMTEKTETNTIENPFKQTLAYTRYILATKYYLFRTDGSQVTNPWLVEDPKTIHTTSYPNITELRKKLSTV